MKLVRLSRSGSYLSRLALLGFASTIASSCTGAARHGDESLYSQGRIHVDPATRARWDAAEKDVEAAGSKINPIRGSDASVSVPFSNKDIETIRALRPSERHGAGDKRILSVLDTTGGKKAIVSSGIVAEVTLVKGSEYKSLSDFHDGWLPLAIVVVPNATRANAARADAVVYPKLKLRSGTSWVYVRQRADSSWTGSLVRIVGDKIEQDQLDVTASTDDLEPILGARFKWEDDDESIWGTCGGKCCKLIAHVAL